MTRTHLIAVGACAIDNILTVPHYPEEDSKLRALSLTKRRGGNCPNSLEVLLQLTSKFAVSDAGAIHTTKHSDTASNNLNPQLSLIATLPSRSSPEIPFITSSFEIQRDITSNNADTTEPSLETPSIDLSNCIYRNSHTEPISSYIICSQSTSSRTIINHNDLPEMTFAEFVEATRDILSSAGSESNIDIDELEGLDGDSSCSSSLTWFHFEGRIPQTTLECIRYLREHPVFNDSTTTTPSTLRISVELEKPGREGLQELAFEADVVFYSRSWAEAEGYDSAESCLMGQARLFLNHGREQKSPRERLLICTWSDQGACALRLSSLEKKSRIHTTEGDVIDSGILKQQIIHSPAYTDQAKPILDTVGAGDTFIAGMLFSLLCRSHNHPNPNDHRYTVALEQTTPRQPVWSLQQKLDFANGLAGRKVLQIGFQGLGGQLEGLVKGFDRVGVE